MVTLEQLRTQAVEDPLPGPASVLSRQLRKLGALYVEHKFGAAPVQVEGLPGVVVQLRGKRCAIAVSTRPVEMSDKQARIYVPKIHLVADGIAVLGFSCVADFDPFVQKIRAVTEFNLAGWLPASVVLRYPADPAGLVCVPYKEFKSIRRNIHV